MTALDNFQTPFVPDSLPEFSFQDTDFYYGDLPSIQPAESYNFDDMEMFTFDGPSTSDFGDLGYE